MGEFVASTFINIIIIISYLSSNAQTFGFGQWKGRHDIATVIECVSSGRPCRRSVQKSTYARKLWVELGLSKSQFTHAKRERHTHTILIDKRLIDRQH